MAGWAELTTPARGGVLAAAAVVAALGLWAVLQGRTPPAEPASLLGAAEAASGVARDFKRGEILPERIVGEEAATQRFADAGDELDRFERLKTADHAAERAEDAGFAAVGDGAGRGWLGEKAAVARAALGGVEDADLALEAINAAVDERTAGEGGGVVVEVAGGKIVGSVDDDVVARDEIEHIRGVHDGFVLNDAHIGMSKQCGSQ